MDLLTATPAEIDGELARIGALLAVQYNLSHRARIKAGQILDNPYFTTELDQPRVDRCHATIREAGVTAHALEAQRAPLDAEYVRRGGWTRYYLVDANNGHVHHDANGYRCSRRNTTVHMWLTSESGRPATEVVADAGERSRGRRWTA